MGIEAAEAPLGELAPGLEVIEDSWGDPRASLHPLLAAVPDARFLAGYIAPETIKATTL